MAKLLILSILALLIVSGMAARYQYLQFVQQWPPAICSGVNIICSVTPLPVFTIHGLWPSNYSTVPSNCKGDEELTFRKLRGLIPYLDAYWPNLLQGSNFMFWKHEWNTHGTCSDPPFSPFNYFQRAVRISANLDLFKILHDARIHPSSNIIRRYIDIAGAISHKTGHTPGLRCNTNAQNQNIYQLSEIIVCYDYFGINIIDCPSTAGINCPSTFVWPGPPQPICVARPQPARPQPSCVVVGNSHVHKASFTKFLIVFNSLFIAFVL